MLSWYCRKTRYKCLPILKWSKRRSVTMEGHQLEVKQVINSFSHRTRNIPLQRRVQRRGSRLLFSILKRQVIHKNYHHTRWVRPKVWKLSTWERRFKPLSLQAQWWILTTLAVLQGVVAVEASKPLFWCSSIRSQTPQSSPTVALESPMRLQFNNNLIMGLWSKDPRDPRRTTEAYKVWLYYNLTNNRTQYFRWTSAFKKRQRLIRLPKISARSKRKHHPHHLLSLQP